MELHFVNVSDENWKFQIEERNKRIIEGNSGSGFYVDDNLMKRLLSIFEQPGKNDVDKWYENNYAESKIV